jgi:S1-C subfamily serine protease
MRALRSSLFAVFAPVSIVVAACAGGETPVAKLPAPEPSASTSTSASEIVVGEIGPRESVTRGAVLDAIKSGLGSFLRYVEVSEVLETKGKKRVFVGWRVVKLRGPAGTWDGVDLRVGDVVTAVNGFKIERENQADSAFRSLAVASEIRVSLVREGAATELRLSIVDDAPPTAPSADGPRADASR